MVAQGEGKRKEIRTEGDHPYVDRIAMEEVCLAQRLYMSRGLLKDRNQVGKEALNKELKKGLSMTSCGCLRGR